MQDVAALNVSAARGVAAQDFGLQHGHGTADYLLYADGRAAGVVEAKTEGHTLTGVETQPGRYGGRTASQPASIRPSPVVSLREHRGGNQIHQRAEPRAAQPECLLRPHSGHACIKTTIREKRLSGTPLQHRSSLRARFATLSFRRLQPPILGAYCRNRYPPRRTAARAERQSERQSVSW